MTRKPRNHPVKKREGASGQAIVEFALLVPVILFLLLIFVDLSRAYFMNQVVLNAAREGARAGVLPEGTPNDVLKAAKVVLKKAGRVNPVTDELIGVEVISANAGSGVPAGTTTSVKVILAFDTLTGTFIPGWEGTIYLTQIVKMRHE